MELPPRIRDLGTYGKASESTIAVSDGNYLLIQDSFRKLSLTNERLEEMDAKSKINGSMGICAFYLLNEGHLKALKAIEDIEDASRKSFNILFQGCAWLPPSSKDMVIEFAHQVAEKFTATCIAVQEDLLDHVILDDTGQPGIEALTRGVSLSLRALAEQYRWNVICYRKIKGPAKDAVSHCYQTAKKIHSWGLPQHDTDFHPSALICVDAEYLYCIFLQNLDFGVLNRSEIVKACLTIQNHAHRIPLQDKPFAETSNMSINDEGELSLHLPGDAKENGSLYFRHSDLHSIVTELESVLDAAHRKHCRRWLSDLIGGSSAHYQTCHRGNVRSKHGELCLIHMGYRAIVEYLRNNLFPRNHSSNERAGAFFDLSKDGCCISFMAADYQRPAIGKLVLITSQSTHTKVGIIRWIKNASGMRKSVTVGIEYVGSYPKVIPAKSDNQWPNGLYVENVICMERAATSKTGSIESINAVHMIQPKKVGLTTRSVEIGGCTRVFKAVEHCETGLDFDVVLCRESTHTAFSSYDKTSPEGIAERAQIHMHPA